jgi:hypothetical protein
VEKVDIQHLRFRCRRDFYYTVPCVIGLVYWAAYFFFHIRVPGARYVLGVTRILSLWIVLLLIDRLHRHDGYLVKTVKEGKTLYSLDVHIPFDEIDKREIIRFRTSDESLAK